MAVTEPAYFTAFKNFEFTRTPSGVLTVRFHTDGGPATFTGQMHSDLPRALYEIGQDRGNRVLVITGTGDRFMTEMRMVGERQSFKPAHWDEIYWEGRQVPTPSVKGLRMRMLLMMLKTQPAAVERLFGSDITASGVWKAPLLRHGSGVTRGHMT